MSVINSLHRLIFSFQKSTSVWFTVWDLFCYSFISHSFHTVHLVMCSAILLAQPAYCHTGCISHSSGISLTMREELKGDIKTVLQDKQDDYLIFPHLCTLRHCSQLYIYMYIYTINSLLRVLCEGQIF